MTQGGRHTWRAEVGVSSRHGRLGVPTVQVQVGYGGGLFASQVVDAGRLHDWAGDEQRPLFRRRRLTLVMFCFACARRAIHCLRILGPWPFVFYAEWDTISSKTIERKLTVPETSGNEHTTGLGRWWCVPRQGQSLTCS
jgi:hypothetical protein